MIQVGDAIWQRAERRGLVQGAVWPVRVVEVLVLAEDGHQVAPVPDQGPVQQLTPAAADPAFHDRVHSRRLNSGADHPDASGPEDDALDLARAAQASADKAGLPALLAKSLIMEAHAHAVNKDASACARALNVAEHAFAKSQTDAPDWLEAGTGLLIDCGSWLRRGDFTSRFITTGTSISDGATLLASIDWEAAVTALLAGDLSASGGERRILLLASSLASWPPASPAEPRSASTTPCPASTAATQALLSELSPMPPGFQIQIEKRTNNT